MGILKIKHLPISNKWGSRMSLFDNFLIYISYHFIITRELVIVREVLEKLHGNFAYKMSIVGE